MPRTPSIRQSASSKLQERLKERNVVVDPGRNGPLWQGPCAEGPNGGITFSMLSRFLSCRERFRVHYIEGIKPVERFNHRTDYGTMWHLCEEALARGDGKDNKRDQWADLDEYCLALQKKFPFDQENILHWYNVCRAQFPIYVEHWRQHDDVQKRVPLMQEQVFDVPYKLPSGRTVRLRGKFDSVDLIDGGVWLQENKTKGDVDVQQIQRQLTFDLQTMMYLIALGNLRHEMVGPRVSGATIKGVRYNVVRRPLSGGKGTIVRHKPTKSNPQGESWGDYYKRVEQVIRENPDHFFARWKTEVLPGDTERFRRECLDLILEQLCQWYDWVSSPQGKYDPFNPHYSKGIHWRHPFGAVNTIDEYGASDVDEYINNRSMTGLRRVNTLFEELV